jgi:hypothetical protein
MSYQFREIRKGECADVIAFAKEHGCEIDHDRLLHHMSLTVKADDELAATAMCIEQASGQIAVTMVHRDGFDHALIAELADRCLRKVQSAGIGAARLTSSADASTASLWQQTNWLDHIQDTANEPTAEALLAGGDAAATA